MNNEHLREYINCHEGESVIIFCSGPTVNQFKFNNEFNDYVIVDIIKGFRK